MLSFQEHGIHVFVYEHHRGSDNPLVDEVRVTPPYANELPCSVRFGESRTATIKLIRQAYPVKNEYDDAIYFQPSSCDELLAAVEFRGGEVACMELMHMAKPARETN
ncbi:hypothetical protein [Limnoglobus roseus]|uniref:Uncharacterized protein n=1 Tax=Limnoglobus roseus TaxID=2598579 RepID=A0A5C1ACE5_9BACT|nr:hypothetical protein [Limnoglobus roseus]QEL15432.1 hypothetical protein PX52LOC_02351 [Limnoglobus roseus]